jgi:beta-galactosidase
MKKINLLSFLILFSIITNAQEVYTATSFFDFGWKFHRGAVKTAMNPAYDDSQWRSVDLPHDWSIEDIPGTQSPFDESAVNQENGGFTVGGIGWYRKTFKVDPSLKGKSFTIVFDGVYMNAQVWLNGRSLGINPYGYTSFFFDISDRILFDRDNVIAVKVATEGENTRWYSGSGIYRHVWLNVDSPVHVATWGTEITTQSADADNASVIVKTTLANKGNSDSEIILKTTIVDKNGIPVATVETKKIIVKGESWTADQAFELKNPMLWSVDNPYLYKAVSEIFTGGEKTGTEETSFGIRTISFDAEKGFRLNGVPMKLRGGCVHHDNGPLGAAAYDRADERRVRILKDNGYNAIRCAHNPPSPAFLEACDKLGMLVIDEAFDMWREGKMYFDYHLYFDDWWEKDIRSMVLRDRNHPSVIMWSIGNEIPNRQDPEVVKVSAMLADYVRNLDPTRPITAAVNMVSERMDPYFSTLDIAGYNYARNSYAPDHERLPQRVIVATESFPLEAFDYWMGVVDNPHVIGDFVWTSFDYMGEAGIGWMGFSQLETFFPWNLAYCGDIDICGWKRPQSYYRDVLWKENQLSLFVKPPVPSFSQEQKRQWTWQDVVADWNWTGYEDKPFEVTVYSSCEQVELFLNGKSLGKKPANRDSRFMAVWQVPYQPGSLKAIGYKGRKQVNISELRTSSEPVIIKAEADRGRISANGQDLVYVTVELKDENGITDPKAENLVRFKIDGPGRIIGVGNANPISTESCTRPERKAWHGRCLVIVKSEKSGGTIKLTAESEGLQQAVVNIESSEL